MLSICAHCTILCSICSTIYDWYRSLRPRSVRQVPKKLSGVPPNTMGSKVYRMYTVQAPNHCIKRCSTTIIFSLCFNQFSGAFQSSNIVHVCNCLQVVHLWNRVLSTFTSLDCWRLNLNFAGRQAETSYAALVKKSCNLLGGNLTLEPSTPMKEWCLLDPSSIHYRPKAIGLKTLLLS